MEFRTKNNLEVAANKQFHNSLSNVTDFLRLVDPERGELSQNEFWLLRSYQLSIILRCLSMEDSDQKGYQTEFDNLFNATMNPFCRTYPDVAGAMNFFGQQEDPIRVSEFVLDVIGLNLPRPLHDVSKLWKLGVKEGSLIPDISKMPFVLTLYFDLACSAGIVIEESLAISQYRIKFDNVLRNKESQLNELRQTLNGIPSDLAQVYQALRPTYLQMADIISGSQ